MSKVEVHGVLIREGVAAASGFIYSRKVLEGMLALLPGVNIVWVRDEKTVGQMSDDPADFEIVAGEDGQAVLTFRNASIEQGSALLRQVMQGVVRAIGVGPEAMARVKKDSEIEEVVCVQAVGVTVDPDDLPFSSGRVTGVEQQGVIGEIGVGPEILAHVEGDRIGEIVRVQAIGMTVTPEDLAVLSGRVTGIEQQSEG